MNPNNQRPQLSSGVVYDRLGRPIKTGDTVHLIGKLDIMWNVAATRPVFTANVPPGTVELVLQAVFMEGVPGGTRIGDLLLVREAPAAGGEASGKIPGDPDDSEGALHG